jgi:alanine racemase
LNAPPGTRWAWAEIDLAALEHNVRLVRATVAPAQVWAVVKADGYGHGSVAVARRALAAGAAGLAVALVEEGVALRRAGIDAPILLLSQQPVDQLSDVVAATLIPTVYTLDYATALAAAAPASYRVHVKVDTGMQRVGVGWASAAALVRAIAERTPSLAVEGVFTHLACADEPSSPATVTQLARFETVLGELDRLGLLPPVVHAANSAGAFAAPTARMSLVRAGIAIYGISPGPGVDHLVGGLEPVLSLRARVSHVKRVAAGSAVSYGWRHRFERDTTVATVPLGYADGVPRRLGTIVGGPEPDRPGADVLIGGLRCPIVGVVTMDQLMVDVGAHDGAAGVAVGDEVVLLGRQGGEQIRAEEWAERLDTIAYEIVCAISKRITRVPVE